MENTSPQQAQASPINLRNAKLMDAKSDGQPRLVAGNKKISINKEKLQKLTKFKKSQKEREAAEESAASGSRPANVITSNNINNINLNPFNAHPFAVSMDPQAQMQLQHFQAAQAAAAMLQQQPSPLYHPPSLMQPQYLTPHQI